MYTDARYKATRKYDTKTYKKYTMSFQKVEDVDIINSIEDAKARGVTKRAWLRELFEGRMIYESNNGTI